MPAKRKLTMRHLRQMLRLSRDGMSVRDIAERLGIARSTVQENLKRAEQAGLSWPLPGELTDEALEGRLLPAPASGRTCAGGPSLTGPKPSSN